MYFLVAEPIDVHDTGVYPAKPDPSLFQWIAQKLRLTQGDYCAPPSLNEELAICLSAYLEPVAEKLKNCLMKKEDLQSALHSLISLRDRFNTMAVVQIKGSIHSQRMYFYGAECDHVSPTGI